MQAPLCIRSWPHAIVHIDGDAFFVSCEIAKRPHLKGKPVVTGNERGIASAFSYEAKKAGVRRGMPIHEVRRICPNVVILSSNYENYSLYAQRMYSIVRRHTPIVEEYSIDECFADISGLRAPRNMSYEQIARKIKQELETELGISFSIGVAPTKVLAKVGSNYDKPSGMVSITGKGIEKYLEGLPLSNIWGIGPQTSAYLTKLGIQDTLEFARKDITWVEAKLSKPFQELWHELRGTKVYSVSTQRRTSQKSITRSRTFRPNTNKPEILKAELAKHMERACAKARRYNLAPREVCFFLKTHAFRYRAVRLRLSAPTTVPGELLSFLYQNWSELFDDRLIYRKTGIVFSQLESRGEVQQDLFGESVARAHREELYETVDELVARYGRDIITTGASLPVIKQRSRILKPTEILAKRQGMGMPFLGDVS